MATLASLIVNLLADTAKFEAQMDQAGARVSELGKTIDETNKRWAKADLSWIDDMAADLDKITNDIYHMAEAEKTAAREMQAMAGTVKNFHGGSKEYMNSMDGQANSANSLATGLNTVRAAAEAIASMTGQVGGFFDVLNTGLRVAADLAMKNPLAASLDLAGGAMRMGGKTFQRVVSDYWSGDSPGTGMLSYVPWLTGIPQAKRWLGNQDASISHENDPRVQAARQKDYELQQQREAQARQEQADADSQVWADRKMESEAKLADVYRESSEQIERMRRQVDMSDVDKAVDDFTKRLVDNARAIDGNVTAMDEEIQTRAAAYRKVKEEEKARKDAEEAAKKAVEAKHKEQQEAQKEYEKREAFRQKYASAEEKARDAIEEAARLSHGGYIDRQTARRAASDAFSNYREEVLRRNKDQLAPTMEAGSLSAYQATITGANDPLNRLSDTQAQALNVAEEQLEQLEEIASMLGELETVAL